MPSRSDGGTSLLICLKYLIFVFLVVLVTTVTVPVFAGYIQDNFANVYLNHSLWITTHYSLGSPKMGNYPSVWTAGGGTLQEVLPNNVTAGASVGVRTLHHELFNSSQIYITNAGWNSYGMMYISPDATTLKPNISLNYYGIGVDSNNWLVGVRRTGGSQVTLFSLNIWAGAGIVNITRVINASGTFADFYYDDTLGGGMIRRYSESWALSTDDLYVYAATLQGIWANPTYTYDDFAWVYTDTTSGDDPDPWTGSIVSDNFNDNIFNFAKWDKILVGAPTVSEVGQQIQVTVNFGEVGGFALKDVQDMKYGYSRVAIGGSYINLLMWSLNPYINGSDPLATHTDYYAVWYDAWGPAYRFVRCVGGVKTWWNMSFQAVWWGALNMVHNGTHVLASVGSWADQEYRWWDAMPSGADAWALSSTNVYIGMFVHDQNVGLFTAAFDDYWSIGNYSSFGPAGPVIEQVNQSETDPWTMDSHGWLNITLNHSVGWANLSTVDIQVNTTGDAQTFTLRWNRTGYTLTEVSDVDNICNLENWWNSTGGFDVAIYINMTIGNATAGWCDKYVNATGDGPASYSKLTNNAFLLVGPLSVHSQFETDPWIMGGYGWFNITMNHTLGWSNIDYFDMAFNTTSDSERFTLRWNQTGFTLTEVLDTDNVCIIGNWWNTTAGNLLHVYINMSLSGATPGYIDKNISSGMFVDVSSDVVWLYYDVGTVIVRVLDNATSSSISGADVFIWNGTWSSSGVSNATGYVYFYNVWNGTYSINGSIFSHYYNWTTVPVVNKSLHMYTWNLYLEPKFGYIQDDFANMYLNHSLWITTHYSVGSPKMWNYPWIYTVGGGNLQGTLPNNVTADASVGIRTLHHELFDSSQISIDNQGWNSYGVMYISPNATTLRPTLLSDYYGIGLCPSGDVFGVRRTGGGAEVILFNLTLNIGGVVNITRVVNASGTFADFYYDDTLGGGMIRRFSESWGLSTDDLYVYATTHQGIWANPTYIYDDFAWAYRLTISGDEPVPWSGDIVEDDFNDNIFNFTKWNKVLVGAPTVLEVGQQIRVTVNIGDIGGFALKDIQDMKYGCSRVAIEGSYVHLLMWSLDPYVNGSDPLATHTDYYAMWYDAFAPAYRFVRCVGGVQTWWNMTFQNVNWGVMSMIHNGTHVLGSLSGGLDQEYRWWDALPSGADPWALSSTDVYIAAFVYDQNQGLFTAPFDDFWAIGNYSYGAPPGPAVIEWVNQTETHPWTMDSSGWLNITLNHSIGWANLSTIDIQVNTTGDAQNFTLRWNRTGYTLVEVSDADNICNIENWWNSTGGFDVALYINLTIGNATAGWCDKYINATGDGSAIYSNLTNNVFLLQLFVGPLFVHNQSETDPWAVGNYGWFNVTVNHTSGWSNITYLDMSFNTTGDSEVFTLRWNQTGFTLTEVLDTDNVCVVGNWWNVTGGQLLSIFINMSISGATPGYVDKNISSTGFVNVTMGVFWLYYDVGMVIVRVLDNTTAHPISGADVFIWNATWSDNDVSDGGGFVYFPSVWNATYSINGSIYSHQYNWTTIPKVNKSLHMYTWNLYLHPTNGNWTHVHVVDNVTGIGIPYASVGFWNATISVIGTANCSGWVGFWVVDGNYNCNASAPYWYAFNSSAIAIPPYNFTLELGQNRVFPVDEPSPWNFYFPYMEPWGQVGASGANLTFSDFWQGWIWQSQLVWLDPTTAMFRVVYVTPTNSSRISFQTRAPPLDDVPVDLYAWGPAFSNYTRWVNGYCDHSVNQTIWNSSIGGSVWFFVLDNLYPGKLYYFTIYPGLSISSWGPSGSFRTPNATTEYAYSFGNGSSSWLLRNAAMDEWGEWINCSSHPNIWNRANWDHYWYGDNLANATGLTNICNVFDNSTDLIFTTRIAVQNQSDGALPFPGLGMRGIGEGTSFGLYNPQTGKWVARVALAHLGPAWFYSAGRGFYAWHGVDEEFKRTGDGLPYWGDWRCFNTWWNVTIVIPREAMCGSGNEGSWWDYNYDVYIEGPGWGTSTYRKYVGSYPLGGVVCDGLFAVYEYLPTGSWVTSHYGGVVPNNHEAAWDFTRLSNVSTNLTFHDLWSDYHYEDPDEPPEDGDGEGPEYTLYPRYWSHNYIPDYNTFWLQEGTYGCTYPCTYFDAHGNERNMLGARENNISDCNTYIPVNRDNATFVWFNMSDWDYRDQCHEPLFSWPAEWLVVCIWPTQINPISMYLDMMYLSSGTEWLTLAFANITLGRDVPITILSWNSTLYNVSLGGTVYKGQWEHQTFRQNGTGAAMIANEKYAVAGYDHRIDIPQYWINLSKPTAYPSFYHNNSPTVSGWPYGPAYSAPHQIKSMDCYRWYLSENSGSGDTWSFGTAWFANATGAGSFPLPGLESYLCFQRQTNIYSSSNFVNPVAEQDSWSDAYVDKMMFVRNATDGYFVMLPAGGHSSSGIMNEENIMYFVLGVNDTLVYPFYEDHTYSQGCIYNTLWQEDWPTDTLKSQRWNFTWIPLGLGTNITLPAGVSSVEYPKIAQWYFNLSYNRMGHWVVDWWNQSYAGVEQNDTFAGLHESLRAVDMYFYVLGEGWAGSGGSPGYYLGDEWVMMADAVALGHNNPLEPVLQLASTVPRYQQLGYGLNKIVAFSNGTGMYWGICQLNDLKYPQVVDGSYGIWRYDMTNLDLAPHPDWSDHTYGVESGAGGSSAAFYKYPPSYVNNSWDIIAMDYSAINNITSPGGVNRSDCTSPLGWTRGMTAEGMPLHPSYTTTGVDWRNVGIANSSNFPFWWKAVDFFRASPSGMDKLPGGELPHSRFQSPWGAAWTSPNERDGIWDVGTFFFDTSTVTSDVYPTIAFQLRDAVWWDVGGSEVALCDKVFWIYNVTYPGGVFAFYTHTPLDATPVEPTHNESFFFTLVTKSGASLDATPAWSDHSYMPHTNGGLYRWDAPVGSYGGGWREIPLNWSQNVTLPPSWTDAEWASGQIYNGSAWAGWFEDVNPNGNSTDDPMMWEMSLAMRAVDEFWDGRSGQPCGWAAEGHWPDYSYPLNFAINGTWANLTGISNVPASQYVVFQGDDLLRDVDSPPLFAYTFVDKLWFRRNATHFDMAFRVMFSDKGDQCPVLLVQDSIGTDEGYLRMNASTWPYVHTVDVLDYGQLYGRVRSWTSITWDLRPVGLPDHDDTCPMTKFLYPNQVFEVDGMWNTWEDDDLGDNFIVDGRRGLDVGCGPVQSGRVLAYFNSSMFGLESLGDLIAIDFFDPNTLGFPDVYTKKFGMKLNSSGSYVGFYVHGAHAPTSPNPIYYYQGMTPHIVSANVTPGDSLGSEGFAITGVTVTTWINCSSFSSIGIPPNGRWIWFRVIFFAGDAHISFETNYWMSAPQKADMIDHYQSLRVHYIYELVIPGFPVYVHFYNSSCLLGSMDVSGRDFWGWDFFVFRFNRSISSGTYNWSIGDADNNIILCTRRITVIRPLASWDMDYEVLYYRVYNEFRAMCSNYRYWREHYNWYHPPDGEAAGRVTVVLPGNITISSAVVTFNNDTNSVDYRDLVGDCSIFIPNPGSGISRVEVRLYINRGEDYHLVMSRNATLESSAMFIGGFEEVAYILGLPARLVSMCFALCLAGVVTILSTRFIRNAFAVILVFAATLFTAALMGWFPVWIPILGLSAMGLIYWRLPS